ncbi:MAG: hypothetical protein J07HX64_00460 [halophilic archaeon J07HX64]|nr:MAG: hypothetical protein J07HX64_00460 [halophilic archaeon J07HX64]
MSFELVEPAVDGRQRDVTQLASFFERDASLSVARICRV